MAEPARDLREWYRLRAAQVTQGSNVETDKELFMNKQTSVDTSKKMGGQAPAAGKPVPTVIGRKGEPVGGVKAGHGSVKVESRSVKGGHD